MMRYPKYRSHRLRKISGLRSLVKETRLSIKDFVYPIFVKTGSNIRSEIESMPGCYHISTDNLITEIEELQNLGIQAILLFGLPNKKTPTGSEAYNINGVVQKSVQIIKARFPDMVIITDLCLCQYTSHGHCGLIRNGEIENDKTLDRYQRIALSHAKSGSDVIAPSGMMDGQVKAIRNVLDNNGFKEMPIMSYGAKHASSLYGPFRHAALSSPLEGSRKSYQIDPSNKRMSLNQLETDISEGADIVIIKPAFAYLDIVKEASGRFKTPIAAYNVSGEYSMVKAAVEKGWISEKEVVIELLTGIKRSGADIIISYHAKDVARWVLSGS